MNDIKLKIIRFDCTLQFHFCVPFELEISHVDSHLDLDRERLLSRPPLSRLLLLSRPPLPLLPPLLISTLTL